MYCTVEDIRKLLPPSITIGSKTIGTPVAGINQVAKDQMTLDEVNYYIRYASQEIDARLRSFYSCPLRRIKSFETEVLNPIYAGNDVIVRVHDSGPFSKGDLVRIQEQFGYENVTIKDVPDFTTIILANAINHYDEGTLISILKYPDPIGLLATRLAVSYGFDRLFVSQQSPDISNYGKANRDMATNAMDSVLTGAIMLVGQEWTGRRFCRSPLYDAFKSPIDDFQFGREKSG